MIIETSFLEETSHTQSGLKTVDFSGCISLSLENPSGVDERLIFPRRNENSRLVLFVGLKFLFDCVVPPIRIWSRHCFLEGGGFIPFCYVYFKSGWPFDSAPISQTWTLINGLLVSILIWFNDTFIVSLFFLICM